MVETEDIEISGCLLNPAGWQENYYKSLYRFASTKLTDRHLIEDLIQDTFLEGLKQAGGFRQRSTEKTWLFAILKYKIYKVYREERNNKISYSVSLTLGDESSIELDFDKYTGKQNLKTAM